MKYEFANWVLSKERPYDAVPAITIGDRTYIKNGQRFVNKNDAIQVAQTDSEHIAEIIKHALTIAGYVLKE